MPTLQSSTGRHLLFVAAFVGLAFAASAASAIDPDQRGRLAAAEPPLAGKAASAPKDGEKRIKLFEKRNEPWTAVFDWLATQTGIGVTVSQLPEGNFTYFGPQ